MMAYVDKTRLAGHCRRNGGLFIENESRKKGPGVIITDADYMWGIREAILQMGPVKNESDAVHG